MSTLFRSLDKSGGKEVRGFTQGISDYTLGGQLGLLDIFDEFIEGLQFPHIPESPTVSSGAYGPLRAPDVRTTSLLGGDG